MKSQQHCDPNILNLTEHEHGTHVKVFFNAIDTSVCINQAVYLFFRKSFGDVVRLSATSHLAKGTLE